MKAIVCTQYGPPDLLELQDVETPILGDDEVLLRVHAASVTYSTLMFRGVDLFIEPVSRGIGVTISPEERSREKHG